MISKLLAAIALASASVGGTYAGLDLLEDVIPVATESTSTTSAIIVSDRAFEIHILGTSWPEALDIAIQELRRGGEQLSLDGTTLTWQYETGCFRYELPQPTTPVKSQPC